MSELAPPPHELLRRGQRLEMLRVKAHQIARLELELRLEIDARQIHGDPNRANNQITQSVSFQKAAPVCVMTVPVRTHTPLPSVYDPNFFAMVDQMERRWPTPDVWVFRDTDPVEELQTVWPRLAGQN